MKKRRRTSLLTLLIAVMILTGCGGKKAAPVQNTAVTTIAAVTATDPVKEDTSAAVPTEISDTVEPTATPTPEQMAEATVTATPEPTEIQEASPTAAAEATPEPTATPTPEPTATPSPEPTATPSPEPTVTPIPTATPTPEPVQVVAAIDANGSYTSKDDVALYIHTYGTLPGNFITKKEAQALGWPGGGLDAYAPGKCIGGDYFGNYEGKLPDGNYHECDIDTLGKNSRGAKRIIYSDTGAVYYTDDHYESFTQLY